MQVVNVDVLKINYKDDNVCAPNQAISANIDIRLVEGAIQKYLSTRKMISCWANDTERGRRILEGKATRIPK